MKTVGLYSFNDIPSMHDFWRSCGSDRLEFWVLDVKAMSEGQLEDYCTRMAKEIHSAKEAGFEVWVGFQTNFKVSEGDTPWYFSLFHPRNQVEMEAREAILRQSVAACGEADGLMMFGADPGGITEDLGEGKLEDYLLLTERFVQVFRQVLPEKPIVINPWALSAFATPDYTPWQACFWQRESEMLRGLLADENTVNASVGVELPCHDYYRALTLRCYEQEQVQPDPFPRKEELETLKQKGVERIWSWPYFLLDECDDGDGAGGGVQLETRYIHQLLTTLRQLGFNGVTGNWSGGGAYTRAVNFYAFARMAKDASLTAQKAIGEYARLLVEEEWAATVEGVLRFIENDSNWHKKMPASHQLPAFDTPFASSAEALAALNKVQWREKAPGEFRLPEAPEAFGKRLKLRLEAMLQKEG
ncbi:MAG: hypothetical protein IKD06_04795 [Clostridia bacterium]|nr:hypothetical protein [Clostridia bacterium]